MEEVDVLCDRIGVLRNGRIGLRGTPSELKKKCGNSIFHLRINSVGLDEQEISRRVWGIFPGAREMESFEKLKLFEIEISVGELSNFFIQVDNLKQDLHFQQWSLSKVGLEDIFVQSGIFSPQ
jgi:ABC-type multidrug transport system ATPase subunit